mgnify:CR=1 FL=1
MRFEDKVVVVTGGGQGIGRVVCQTFAKEGAKVVIAEVDEEAGRECEELITSTGGKALFIKTDVADEDSVKNLFLQTVKNYSKVSILINNAGIMPEGNIFTRSIDEWNRVIAINLTGPYICSRYAAELMRDGNGGVIINISSTRALMSECDTEPYSASKGGLLALTHSLAISLGKYDIRVNSICPGWIEVSQHKKSSLRKMPDLTERDHKQHPVGRVGKAEDIASACLFLASEEASFITGANIIIDGGMTVKMIYEE